MNGIFGKRPRHYAAEIMMLPTAKERRAALKSVPENMRATTKLHVQLALDDVAIGRHVSTIANTRRRTKRVELLDQVPPAIRDEVRERVIERMRARQVAA